MSIERHIGFIGCGKMGGALASSLVAASVLSADHLHLYDKDAEILGRSSRITGGVAQPDLSGLWAASDIVLLAVKPQDMPGLLVDLASLQGVPYSVVSIAAGFRLARLRAGLPSVPNLIRAMPNRPALVRAGITALMGDGDTTAMALDEVEAMFRVVGDTVRLGDESEFDAVTALSGSGPAFVFRLIEALVEGGTASGLSRWVATRLAQVTVFGSAKLLLDFETDPAVERQAVSSPGGTTVAGLDVLEKRGFYQAVVEAVRAASRRSRELGGQ